MDFADTIKDALTAYVGLREPAVTSIESVLASIVWQYGKDVLFDDRTLMALLESAGIDVREALRIVLLTKVDGFELLVYGEPKIRRIDLDRFAYNVYRQTGLNRKESARIIRALTLATGTVDELKHLSDWSANPGDASFDGERAFSVPTALYDAELHAFDERLKRAIKNGESVDSLELDKLEPLVAMGIPKAQYYLGYSLLHFSGVPEIQRYGSELIYQAAIAGDSLACAELGDYYYGRGPCEWTTAFAYYTGMGSIALNEPRREALATIINRGRFNKTLLILSAMLLCCMIMTEVLGLGAPIYDRHIVLGVLNALLSIGVLNFGFLHHRIAPYDDTYLFPVIIFGLWVLYMAVRFMF